MNSRQKAKKYKRLYENILATTRKPVAVNYDSRHIHKLIAVSTNELYMLEHQDVLIRELVQKIYDELVNYIEFEIEEDIPKMQFKARASLTILCK